MQTESDPKQLLTGNIQKEKQSNISGGDHQVSESFKSTLCVTDDQASTAYGRCGLLTGLPNHQKDFARNLGDRNAYLGKRTGPYTLIVPKCWDAKEKKSHNGLCGVFHWQWSLLML